VPRDGTPFLLAAAVRALRCPRPPVMAPTIAGPPVRDPKMARERSDCTRCAIHSRSPHGARTAPLGSSWFQAGSVALRVRLRMRFGE
jgi:hypothetical protein